MPVDFNPSELREDSSDKMKAYKCEYCDTEVETEAELEIEHRACRLKAAFPAAYTEQGAGLVTFDIKKVSESLGLFNDIVIGRDGQPLHPLEGDLHFRIGAGWNEPEIWIEVPVQVGNCLSSWAFRITTQDWLKLSTAISLGIDTATKYLEQKKLARATTTLDREMVSLEINPVSLGW